MNFIQFAFLCECGRADCHEELSVTDELYVDFNEYRYQRDSYCLISKSCPGLSNFSLDKVAVEGDNYYIFDEGKND